MTQRVEVMEVVTKQQQKDLQVSTSRFVASTHTLPVCHWLLHGIVCLSLRRRSESNCCRSCRVLR